MSLVRARSSALVSGETASITIGKARDYVDAVVEAYRHRSPVDDGALAWYTAVGLVDQALATARRLGPGWREGAAELLDAGAMSARPRATSRA